MNELAVVEKGADWRRLKALVLDGVSSPITKPPGIAERAPGPPPPATVPIFHTQRRTS
jgi:hypothetical protein